MARTWKKGDWVRERATGRVFQVDRFSSMDGLGFCPIRPNKNAGPGEPMFVRFDPDELEEATALDRIADAL